ncbi:hypothetical protein CDAR_185291 [Caerostris darwini]|uniref:Uncharacterized protein n=1 Tax=Caerostris darwini TaxID=1538125 RepID=A0AAV4SNM3_9ARAC|nr:hypothetical protein CDAR_185291 [Caerostris darwini]
MFSERAIKCPHSGFCSNGAPQGRNSGRKRRGGVEQPPHPHPHQLIPLLQKHRRRSDAPISLPPLHRGELIPPASPPSPAPSFSILSLGHHLMQRRNAAFAGLPSLLEIVVAKLNCRQVLEMFKYF